MTLKTGPICFANIYVFCAKGGPFLMALVLHFVVLLLSSYFLFLLGHFFPRNCIFCISRHRNKGRIMVLYLFYIILFIYVNQNISLNCDDWLRLFSLV